MSCSNQNNPQSRPQCFVLKRGFGPTEPHQSCEEERGGERDRSKWLPFQELNLFLPLFLNLACTHKPVKKHGNLILFFSKCFFSPIPKSKRLCIDTLSMSSSVCLIGWGHSICCFHSHYKFVSLLMKHIFFVNILYMSPCLLQMAYGLK